MVSDLVLQPHCDLHMTLSGTPQLVLRLFRREDTPGNPNLYRLTPIMPVPSPAPTPPPPAVAVDFFAPHIAPPHRLDPATLPSVDPRTGVVTARALGVFLFQVRVGQEYIVGRLQVHSQMLAWWFGNDSITTALDPAIAHAQPSIYAKFSDDPGTGTDLIGDITGHRYFTLTSTDTTKFEVTPDGRLRGVVEAGTPADLSGTFLGKTNTLPVRVADYGRHRRELLPVQVPGLSKASQMHNLVFLAEGFRQGDKARFDEIVTRATDEIFDMERHQPYPMLEGSFNIFKVFVASQQHALTVGPRITDTNVGLGAGLPIPYLRKASSNPEVYAMQDLVRRVGLPMRGESRPDLAAVWAGQGLADFKREKVDAELITAWKAHQSVGILHARDTFFGIHLGHRWADRTSGFSQGSAVPPPAAGDVPGNADLSKFISRLYEFFKTGATRAVTPDPRRHPPELYVDRHETNPGISILRYLTGLEYAFPPFPPIGAEWAPDATKFRPSKGLVALVINDDMNGGSNINNSTLTALTSAKNKRMSFGYTTPPGSPADKREMRRTPPEDIDTNYAEITNTVAHEFGHSFNLGDEYENIGGDGDDALTATADSSQDNVSLLGFLRLGTSGRDLDATKVKWFALPRMRVADRLIVDSVTDGGGIKVTIDKRFIGKWKKVNLESTKVHLRNFDPPRSGQQLPLPKDPANVLEDLTITALDEAAGTMTLVGPAPPFPVFKKGSAIFVPLRDSEGKPVPVVEKKVLAHLTQFHKPLNVDPDTTKPKDEKDNPVSIAGFKGPCKSSKLIGVYEGALNFAGAHYRPTGACKMRNSDDSENDGEFCYVCKWLIVNRIDAGYHAILSAEYYPEAKKRG